MPEVTKHEPGTFCWVELSTTDIEAATAFYSKLFGWNAKTNPMPEGPEYTGFDLNDKAVGGGYVQPEQERDMGLPPHWNLYVYTDDVDKTVAKATELGANVMVAGMDLGMGRMGVFADPAGAVISVWQSDQMPGFAVKGEHGTYVWAELTGVDADRAAPFYRDLFGWNPDPQGEEFGNYVLFKRGDQGEAGMMPSTGDESPPAWVAYFAVDDADAIVQAVGDNGGSVIVPATDIPTVGRFAVLQDPQGAVFAVIKGEPDSGM